MIQWDFFVESDSATTFVGSFVDVFVEVSYELGEPNSQRLTNPEQGRHCNWPPCLDLLPVPGRKSKRNHVLLAVAPLAAKRLDALSEGLEEFLLIRHPIRSTLTRAEVPRAD